MILMFIHFACTNDTGKPAPLEQPTSEPADLVFLNGKIYLDQHENRDKIASKDGYIIATGSDVDSLISDETEIIDLNGQIALPGFHDNHTHLLAGSFVMDKLLLVGVSSMDTILRKTDEYVSSAPDVPWIVGYGWVLSLMDNPTGILLDDVVNDRPVAIFDSSGHSLLVNSKTLALAGITADTPDPPGGEIVKDPLTGEPTGLLKEAALNMVSPLMLDAFDDQSLAANLGQEISNFHIAGVTSISEILAVPGVDLGRPWIYAELENHNTLNLRVNYYMPAFTIEDVENVTDLRTLYDGNLLRFAGVKLWVDGSTSSAEAWSLQAAANNPDNFGTHYLSVVDIKAFVEHAENNQYGLKFHVNGDAAVQASLDALEQVFDEAGGLDQTYTFEHAALIDPIDYARMGHLGVCASLQPGLGAIGMFSDQAEAWDDGRMERAWDFRALADAGIPITLGTDWPVWPTPDIMVNLRTAIDGLGSRSLSRQEAFYAYTQASSQCSGLDTNNGCLQEGCPLDLVVLDKDPFTVETPDIATIDISQVWLAGQQIR